jgi:CRP-like cAMP-binding protein
VVLGASTPTERAVVQVPGRAITLTADQFTRAAAVVDGPFYAVMRRYAQVLFTQLARNAGCNRVHTVQQRAARWLLTTADRMRSPTFDLTQEFLAQMLSVRRASVSRVARGLARTGTITCTRGTLTIVDRQQLESCTCDCYRVLQDATHRALGSGATRS